MDAVPELTPWISDDNRQDESYGHVYWVTVPDASTFLVRSQGPHHAAEYAVMELGYSTVDEMVERCLVTPTHDDDDVAALGLKTIDVYPGQREWASDGEYVYEATWNGPAFRASVVGYSDDSEHEAVENLVAALRELSVAGSVRVCRPFEPEPVPLSQWRATPDEDDE